MNHNLIILGGLIHFAILSASALTPLVLDWRAALQPLHPLLRTMFWVYGAFIVLVIICFGSLSLAFAPEFAAGGSLARGVAAVIAIFWLARLAVQLWIFDAKPFLRNGWLKAGYHALTVAFIVLTLIYGNIALEVLR